MIAAVVVLSFACMILMATSIMFFRLMKFAEANDLSNGRVIQSLIEEAKLERAENKKLRAKIRRMGDGGSSVEDFRTFRQPDGR